MPAPTAFDDARTGTPDGSAGIKLVTLIANETTCFEIPVGVALSDLIVCSCSPHRAAMTTTDTNKDMVGFGSSATTDLGGSCAEFTRNRGALVVWAQFASSCGSATVRPIYFDAQTTPQPIGAGSLLTFTAVELYAATGLSSCGDKLSRPQLIDTAGAGMFKLRLETLTNSSDGVDVFGVPV